MDQLNIRLASVADARAISEVKYSAVHVLAAGTYTDKLLDAWAPPATPEQIDKYLKETFANETTLVAEIDGTVFGYGAIEESAGELRALYIHPRFRNKGAAVALLRALEKLAEASGCKAITGIASVTGLAFLRRHGYKETGPYEFDLGAIGKLACTCVRKEIALQLDAGPANPPLRAQA